MDKRTRMAIVLVALILGGNLAYTSYHQKKNPPPPRPSRTAEQTAPADRGPVGTKDMTAKDMTIPPSYPSEQTPGTTSGTDALTGPFQLADGSEGELVIETPLQRLRIARAGGVVRGLQLPQFQIGSTTTPVDLVPTAFGASAAGLEVPSERTGLGLTVRAGVAEYDLAAARFDPAPGDFDESGKLVLAAGSGPRTILLRTEAAGGGALVKRFTIDPDRYDFGFDLELDPGAGLPRIDAYTLGWTTGMPHTEGNPKEDEPRFKVIASIDQQLVRKKPGDFKTAGAAEFAGTVNWTAMQSKYFMVGLVPTTPQHAKVELLGQGKTQWMGMRIAQPTPWRAGADTYRVYAGPIDYDHIRSLGVGLDATVELGWRWIRPISQLLLHFMQFLNKYIPNYGVIILIVSALAKLVFWPLTERSMKSMKRMQDLQPRMEEIKRRYKDDPKAMNEQVMAMYREQKVNPVGGCMPILIQTPMFFALFSVLQSNIELRNAPFVGWITNLAAPDVLYTLPVTLPVIGNHISLLPLLMGGSMLWQSAIGSTMAPPSASGGPMASQQFMMKWVMPIMMTFFFYKMPSGLVIYWIVNTLMSIAQQMQINRKYGTPTAAVVAAAPKPAPKPEGGARHARPDRVDGTERRGSAAERPRRVGRQAR